MRWLISCAKKSRVQSVYRILNGASTAILGLTFCGIFPGYLHRLPNTLKSYSTMNSRFGKSQENLAAERTATGRPTSLREITNTGSREWDNNMVELKG